MASNLRAMASTLASTLVGMAPNLLAMASNLIAMACTPGDEFFMLLAFVSGPTTSSRCPCTSGSLEVDAVLLWSARTRYVRGVLW